MAEQAQVNIVCLKWGKRYPVSFTNTLYASVKRHLHRPFRFVCFTDDATGLAEGIDAQPLPECPGEAVLPQGPWPNIFVKLCLFRDGLAGLQGPTLFFDVDVVILDLELKEGDGLSFLEEVKTLEKDKPFIFVVTNTVSEITLNMVRENGSDYIYQKTNQSYTPGKILSIIDKVFVYKRARRTLDEEQAIDLLSEQESLRVTRRYVSNQTK